ncbi:unnamed protein product [Lactuca virosa]|uniref:Uncharacterized protein n=1 Tax=Lactuca virosa TaxID=75947 RepID=A0AAU9MT81_9ASTR|nr:unnamed protein product [Lactuca virosa]
MIDAIRAKRERLRQSRAAAPDYITLDGGSNHHEAEAQTTSANKCSPHYIIFSHGRGGNDKGVMNKCPVKERHDPHGRLSMSTRPWDHPPPPEREFFRKEQRNKCPVKERHDPHGRLSTSTRPWDHPPPPEREFFRKEQRNRDGERHDASKKRRVNEPPHSPLPSDEVVAGVITSSPETDFKSISTAVENVHSEVVSLRKDIHGFMSMIKAFQHIPFDSSHQD